MKKILLYLIAILSPIIFISNVNAATSTNWFQNDPDKQPLIYVEGYNWATYPSSYETLPVSSELVYSQAFDTGGNDVDESWYGIKTNSSVNVHTQGVSFTFQPNIRFVANYLYSVTLYTCNSVYSPFNATATIQKASTSALTADMVYTYTNRNSVSNVLANDATSCPNAYAYTSLVVPEVNGNFIAYRFTSETSITSQFLLLGYEIKELGIYDESLKSSLTSIINSSGLATAKSINEVKSSINTMSSEITSAQNETNNKLDETNNSITSESDDTESSSCGIICKLKGIFTGITNLPNLIWGFFESGLKALFVPTDEQLQDIIDRSAELSENFGFVGEAVSFFINIFTSLLGLVNEEGCITLPEFTIGETSLTDSITFWNEQRVCLADNPVLSDNINTIRTITSIALVCLFVSFASSKFFSILSKNEREELNKK